MKHLLILILILTGIYSCSNKNELTVDYGKLNPNDFVIYLSAGIPIRLNKNPTLIFKNGEYYDIPNEYGENDWVIIYKGQQQCEFRHFKTNRRYTHKYKFAISEKQGSIFCDINIQGKNNKSYNTICFTTID